MDQWDPVVFQTCVGGVLRLVVVSVDATFVSAPVTVVVGSGVGVSFDGAPVVGSGVIVLVVSITFMAASTVAGALVVNVTFALVVDAAGSVFGDGVIFLAA